MDSFNVHLYWKGRRCFQAVEDLWNYQQVLWELRPEVIIEVGPGECGTYHFLKDLGLNADIISVGEKDDVPRVFDAFIILDGDVYNRQSVEKDLAIYSPMAKYLVVCHTIKIDWGSRSAIANWRNHLFEEFAPPLMSRHTWLKRN